MKKILLMLLTVLCILCVALTVVACQEEHTLGDWIPEKPATCTETGTVGHYHCAHCDKDFDHDGNEITDLTIAAFGHDPVEVQGQQATCTEAGYTAGTKCDRCGELITAHKTEEALGHEPVKIDGQAPTCTDSGVSDCYTCSRCNKYSLTLTGEYVGDSAEDVRQILPANGHSYGDWTVGEAATCTEKGYQKRDCEVCGNTEKSDLDIVAHKSGLILGKKATCTEDGYSDCYQCSMCGKFSLTEQGEYTGNSAEDVRTTETSNGHSFGDWSTFQEATEELPGKESRTCLVCFYVEFKDTPVADHDWDVWQDRGDGYHVRTCKTHPDQQQVEPCAYESNGEFHEATCTEGEYTVYVCGVCNHRNETVHGEPLGHSLGAWVATIEKDVQDSPSDEHVHKHTRICERCKEESTRETEECELKNAVEVAATCITAAYTRTTCDDCGSIHEEITAPANGHSLTYTHKFYGSILHCGHVAVCANCDYTLEEDCKSEVIQHEATCETDRYSEYTCSVCHQGKNISESGTALGHKIEIKFVGDFNAPKHQRKCVRDGCSFEVTEACEITSVETLPTCTQSGTVSKACKVCLYYATENSDAQSVGHVWSSYTSDDETHTHICNVCGQKETNPHDYQVTNDLAATCENPRTLTETCKDCNKQRVTKQGEASGHRWGNVKLFELTHEAQCEVCGENASGNHDWSLSNLCSVCGYDGLTYETSGVHCVVSGNKLVEQAKNIVINEYYKKPDGKGGYDSNTQYRVEEIKEHAFNNNRNIVTLTFPSSVKSIGDYAFYFCTKLETVTLTGSEHNLVSIGESAFHNCGALKVFNPPDTLQSIGRYAFVNCTSLSFIEIGDNVLDIGYNAFYNTDYVNNHEHWTGEVLYLGNHLVKAHQTQNADGSFTNTDVSVRAGTLSIASGAFSTCTNLNKITLPDSLKVVDIDAFKDCNSIAEVVFNGTFAQWLSILFENDYASPLHNSNVFFNITEAKDNIVIPETVTRIPAGTFRKTAIKSVTIPASVKYIGEEAFEDCTQLDTIVFASTDISYIGKDAFKNCAYYTKSENWQDGKALYIEEYLIKAKDLTGVYNVNSGTLLIANNAFDGCVDLEGVVINAELLYIGEGAFANCTSMNSLTFTNTTYTWFARGVIGRALEVTGNMWQPYCYPYNGAWSRSVEA